MTTPKHHHVLCRHPEQKCDCARINEVLEFAEAELESVRIKHQKTKKRGSTLVVGMSLRDLINARTDTASECINAVQKLKIIT